MRRTLGIGTMGLGLLATSFVWAQQPQRESTRQQRQATDRAQGQTQGQEKEFCLATDLIGMTAKAKGEEEVGTIKNLIINNQGEVQYLALSSNSHSSAQADTATDRTRQAQKDRPQQPGETSEARQPRGTANQAHTETMGQLTLVPWDSAKIETGATKDAHYVSVDIEKDRLMQAPSFSHQQLMAPQGQSQLTTQVDQFFNVRQRRGSARPQLDKERQDQQGSQERVPKNQPRQNKNKTDDNDNDN